MNRKQRRPNAKKDLFDRDGPESDVEIIKFPPREKVMKDRCCYAVPEQKSFCQTTDSIENLYNNLPLKKKHTTKPSNHRKIQDVNTAFPDLKKEVSELKRVICNDNVISSDIPIDSATKNNSGYDETEWQLIDDLDQLILGKYDSMPKCFTTRGKSIHISEVPRVKIIAEKFSRYKQNNVELRKLEEKVVCVEYDVFEGAGRYAVPAQVMKAFFSIKPKEDQGNTLTGLPSTLRKKFDITFSDLKKLNEKEVEMIDGKIAENLPYLDDLRNILHRKQLVTTKPTLDLQTLYEIAHMEVSREKNLLTKEELQEVKDLILEKCRSSVYGINRRVIKGAVSDTRATASQAIIYDLLREDSFNRHY